MGITDKIKETVKRSNRIRWQNVSKCHQVIYDNKGRALNVCRGGVVIPQDDESENWWREKLKLNPFFEPVGLTSPPGPSEQKPVLKTGQADSGGGKRGGNIGTTKTETLKFPEAPAGNLSKSNRTPKIQTFKPADVKGGMGLKAEIDGMVPLSGEGNSGTIVENAKPQYPNPNIPEGGEVELTTGKRGYVRRRGRKSNNPSAVETPVVGGGIQTGGGPNGN